MFARGATRCFITLRNTLILALLVSLNLALYVRYRSSHSSELQDSANDAVGVWDRPEDEDVEEVLQDAIERDRLDWIAEHAGNYGDVLNEDEVEDGKVEVDVNVDQQQDDRRYVDVELAAENRDVYSLEDLQEPKNTNTDQERILFEAEAQEAEILETLESDDDVGVIVDNDSGDDEVLAEPVEVPDNVKDIFEPMSEVDHRYLFHGEQRVGRKTDNHALDSQLSKRLDGIVQQMKARISTIEEDHCPVNLDPFDPSILQYIKHPPPVTCSQTQHYLTYVDSGGWLRVNRSEVVLPGSPPHLGDPWLKSRIGNFSPIEEPFDCVYGTFDKQFKSDNEFPVDPYKVLPFEGVKLTRKFVLVACYFKNNTIFYRNVHSWVMPRTRSPSPKPSSRETPSVLLFVIDSISYGIFQRNLPMLSSTLGKHDFVSVTKFVKVGYNTFPNMMPVLTGKRALTAQADMPGEFRTEDFQDMTFDDFPFVWKNFSNNGYVTAFIEDDQEIGLFNYLLQGFERAPVDYYYRPFYVVRDVILPSVMPAPSTPYCYHNQPRLKLLLEQLKSQLEAYSQTRQFTFFFSTEISHNYTSDVERGDKLFSDFFAEILSTNLLDDTLVIVMGDHGDRFGEHRRTKVGFLEERLPMLAIRMPPNLKKLNPQLYGNLRLNSKRLVSHFDIHETLMDVVSQNWHGQQRHPPSRGLSLFYAIPHDRTCAQAGIPDQYCVCYDASPVSISVDNDLALKAANFAIDNVNGLLQNYTGICAKFSLSLVISAEVSELKIKGEPPHMRIRSVILVQPGGVVFESLAKFIPEANEFSAIGDVARASWYGETSHCIDKKLLKKYCFCLDMI